MENVYKPVENKIIRANARDAIRGNIWWFWSLTIVISLITYALGIIPSLFFNESSVLDILAGGSASDIPREINYSGDIWSEVISIILSIIVIPMQFGYYRNVNLLTRGTRNNRWQVLFQNYKSAKSFFKSIGIAILSSIIIILCSILLIVPGIMIAFAYSQAHYIMFDEPDLSVRDTLKKSRDMMRGYKGQLFTLYLSFIGWLILGVLTAGILYIWIYPYISSAMALFYDEVRRAYYKGEDPARPQEEKVTLGNIFDIR